MFSPPLFSVYLVPKFFQKYLAAFITGLLVSASVLGQSADGDDTDLQSWNELQVNVKINKKAELNVSGVVQLQDNVTRVKDGRFGLGMTLKLTDRLSIAPFTLLSRARNGIEAFKTEYRFGLRTVYRFPVKRVGLSHRSQVEYRIRSNGNSWRYRPSVTVEKQMPKSFGSGLKLFATAEPFYDSASGRFSRNRLSIGLNKALSEKLSLDIFYLRQGDNFSNPATAHVIGTTWKVRL